MHGGVAFEPKHSPPPIKKTTKKKITAGKYPDYALYCARTSRLMPWFPGAPMPPPAAQRRD